MKTDRVVRRRSFLLTGLAAMPFLRASTLASQSEPRRARAETRSRIVTLDAKPEPIAIDTAKTAVIVVDMQNDFGAKGGMFDRAGIDISMIQRAISPTARVLASARRAGVKIIYLKMGIVPICQTWVLPTL